MVFQRTYSLMDLLVDLNELKLIGSNTIGICLFFLYNLSR